MSIERPRPFLEKEHNKNCVYVCKPHALSKSSLAFHNFTPQQQKQQQQQADV